MNRWKMVDACCKDCMQRKEILANSSAGIGSTIEDALCECGGQLCVVPSACAVRTPMNSVSFLDGHRDDGGRMASQIATDRAKYEAKQAVKLNNGTTADKQGIFEEQVKKNLRDGEFVPQTTFSV